jgi:cell division protein FtsZ
MKGAKGVIISITGGEDMRLMEVDEAASHIKELVDPDANIIWGSAFNNDLDGKIRVSVVATGIEAEESTRPVTSTAAATQTKVFTFPTRSATATPAPISSTAAAPAATAAAPLDLGGDGDSDELLLDSEDILTSPVGTPPIAPPADEEVAAPKLQRESGTLFERMSSMARAGGKIEEEPAPSLRREPLDIPRFLNRQGNQ